MSSWWSFVLTWSGILAMWMTGRKNRWGWALGIPIQVAWVAYAVLAHQWWFIAGSLVMGTICATSFRSWGKQDGTRAKESA